MELYSDGACSGNPGKGAYAAILKKGDKETKYIKAFKHTTNNRMELLAVIKPLETLKKASEIKIYSDSQYVIKAINEGGLTNWIKKGWIKSNKKPVLNIDLWERMRPLLIKHKLTFYWVKGHADNHYNNKCNDLAIEAYNKNEFIEDDGYNGN